MEETLKMDFHERLRQRIGRPSRVSSVSIRFTEDEVAALRRLAQLEGQTLREWSRERLLREARQSAADPLWTEMIANRMLLMAMLRPLVTGQKMTPERFDELVAAIKAGKRSKAEEVMAQYKAALPQERNDGN